MATLQEQSKLVMARGGWENQPRVTWEERSEVGFKMMEGIMSQISLGIVLDAVMTTPTRDTPLLIPKKEGPFELTTLNFEGQEYHGFYIKENPVLYPTKKVFIFEYSREREQKKVYGKLLHPHDPFDSNLTLNFIAVYNDKALQNPADTDNGKQYVVDYYYEYGDEALIYTISKERFNGLFSLEGKFYSKDENEGKNYTNLIYMPKVRIVSDVNLRLGERADPAVSTFNIVGLPAHTGKNSTIVEITRLGTDVDGNI